MSFTSSQVTTYDSTMAYSVGDSTTSNDYWDSVSTTWVETTTYVSTWFTTSDADLTQAAMYWPVAADDYCNCITIPDTSSATGEQDGMAGTYYWGTFQVETEDGSYYDFFFDPADVYSKCPSSATLDVTGGDVAICEFDFTVETSSGTKKSKKATPSDEATTPSLRKEGTDDGKKTRIHLTVHRMLTTFIEAVFALQYPIA